MSTEPSLNLAADGAEHFPAAALGQLDMLEAALVGLPPKVPGLRLTKGGALAALLAVESPIGALAVRAIGDAARPVRILLLDKTAVANWALGWHQDRTIAVIERIDVPGFGPWTVKKGIPHVAPPFSIAAAMITMRIHLDPVTTDNAPLLIAPGSHRALVREGDIDEEVERRGVRTCVAEAGDVWAYATLILHASKAAALPTRRRVLQVDYAAVDLPGGLRWCGI